MSAALVSVGVRSAPGGGKGGRGSEVRLAERDRGRTFIDECFMDMYNAAKNIPFKFQSGVCPSIKVKQNRFDVIYLIC